MVNPVRSTPGFYTRDQQSWLCGRSRGHVTTIRSRKGGRTVEVVDRGRWLFITLEHSPVQRDRFKWVTIRGTRLGWKYIYLS